MPGCFFTTLEPPGGPAWSLTGGATACQRGERCRVVRAAAADGGLALHLAVDLFVDQDCQAVAIGGRAQLVQHLACDPHLRRRERPRLRDKGGIAQYLHRTVEGVPAQTLPVLEDASKLGVS